VHHHDSRIMEENEDCIVSLFPRGLNHSMQIAHITLFEHWFFSGNSKGVLVRRSEDMEPFIKTINQILISPKNELCSHFDGEVHTEKTSYVLNHDLIPPLFIPPEFFRNKIKIAYGFNDYREGWVNINPLKEKYSFMDKNGTDLKIGIDEIPLFWKKRISKIEINKNMNKEKTDFAIKDRRKLLENPLPKKSSLYWKIYRLKSNLFISLHKINFIRDPIKNLMNDSEKFRNLYIKMIRVKA
ncbi:MAG: hypothetical protein Q8P81_01890, partial [Nanoarchaeota archaeon]|nr:hypothetical protein [Nanoarchaeota archaeon]